MYQYICRKCKKCCYSAADLERLIDKRCPHCQEEALHPAPKIPEVDYSTGRLVWHEQPYWVPAKNMKAAPNDQIGKRPTLKNYISILSKGG